MKQLATFLAGIVVGRLSTLVRVERQVDLDPGLAMFYASNPEFAREISEILSKNPNGSTRLQFITGLAGKRRDPLH